jgi:methionine biosynthesis protein MetW
VLPTTAGEQKSIVGNLSEKADNFFYHFRLISEALFGPIPDYYEMFSDYEEYHKRDSIDPLSFRRALIIADIIGPEAKILDVGCGDGTVAAYLKQAKNAKVVGLDISQKAIESFVKKTGFQGYVRDVDKGLGLKDDEFYDYIIFAEVLEHLKYPHKVLTEAVNHAKYVIVSIPNAGWIVWRLQMLRGYFPRHSFTHLHYWTVNDFYLFCKKLGIRIIDFKTFLPKSTIYSKIILKFSNLLAYQSVFVLRGRR